MDKPWTEDIGNLLQLLTETFEDKSLEVKASDALEVKFLLKTILNLNGVMFQGSSVTVMLKTFCLMSLLIYLGNF